MGYWKELPYRGDGEPKESKPRRRFVNIKRNRRELAVSILTIFLIFAVPFGCLFILGQSPFGNDTTETASAMIGLIFILTFIAGIVSISKFRKGYDIEVSNEPEDQKDKRSSEHKNNTIDL